MANPTKSRYIIQSIVHAADVLKAFRGEAEVLTLRDVQERTSLSKATCFRILFTLHRCGMIEKTGKNSYRASASALSQRRFRIGYAAQGVDASFPREVNSSIGQAAAAAQVELVMLDNRYDAKIALRNAEQLVREEVDLAIEFQTDESAAPAVADKFLQAGIPLIAIDVPHPGATYYGANNYEAGLLGGRHLGRWAVRHWDGEADELVLVGISRAGSIPEARMRGSLVGLHETMRGSDSIRVQHLDGDGQFGLTLDAVRRHLRITKAKRILVAAATDPSAIGALRAFQEAGRAPDCAVVGHNADQEGRAELRESRTRLIGSVAYFPERYGPGVIRLAMDLLAGKPVPPAVFIKHQVVSPESVDHHYPNDALVGALRTS